MDYRCRRRRVNWRYTGGTRVWRSVMTVQPNRRIESNCFTMDVFTLTDDQINAAVIPLVRRLIAGNNPFNTDLSIDWRTGVIWSSLHWGRRTRSTSNHGSWSTSESGSIKHLGYALAQPLTLWTELPWVQEPVFQLEDESHTAQAMRTMSQQVRVTKEIVGELILFLLMLWLFTWLLHCFGGQQLSAKRTTTLKPVVALWKPCWATVLMK